MTVSDPPEVLSRPSNSPLADVYKTQAFQQAWANDVRFHVARNLLHLRRFRGLSQAELGRAAGTSQSAIARIETAQENITLETLERLVTQLNGRFQISIIPGEWPQLQARPWWELSTSGTWRVVGLAGRQNAQTVQVLIGLEQDRGPTYTTTWLPQPAGLLGGNTSTER